MTSHYRRRCGIGHGRVNPSITLTIKQFGKYLKEYFGEFAVICKYFSEFILAFLARLFKNIYIYIFKKKDVESLVVFTADSELLYSSITITHRHTVKIAHGKQPVEICLLPISRLYLNDGVHEAGVPEIGEAADTRLPVLHLASVPVIAVVPAAIHNRCDTRDCSIYRSENGTPLPPPPE
jgi:hypothetical protein